MFKLPKWNERSEKVIVAFCSSSVSSRTSRKVPASSNQSPRPFVNFKCEENFHVSCAGPVKPVSNEWKLTSPARRVSGAARKPQIRLNPNLPIFTFYRFFVVTMLVHMLCYLRWFMFFTFFYVSLQLACK